MSKSKGTDLIKLTIQHEGRGYDLWQQPGEDEKRVLDLDLARWAEHRQPHTIREMIERYEADLDEMGSIHVRNVKTSSPTGGRPRRETYLNEGQALFLLAKMETPKAKAVLMTVIKVFLAVKNGGVSQFEYERLRGEYDARLAQRDRLIADMYHRLSAPRPLIGTTKARDLTCRVTWLLDLALGIADKLERKTPGYRELRSKYLQEAWEAARLAPGAATAWHLLTHDQAALIEQWIKRKEREVKKYLRRLLGSRVRERMVRYEQHLRDLEAQGDKRASETAEKARQTTIEFRDLN